MTELEEQDEREEGGDDRMMNQEKSYRQVSVWCLPLDLEPDDCDREDGDPDEAMQQAPEMCPCA